MRELLRRWELITPFVWLTPQKASRTPTAFLFVSQLGFGELVDARTQFKSLTMEGLWIINNYVFKREGYK